jgi:hypothetical protein
MARRVNGKLLEKARDSGLPEGYPRLIYTLGLARAPCRQHFSSIRWAVSQVGIKRTPGFIHMSLMNY